MGLHYSNKGCCRIGFDSLVMLFILFGITGCSILPTILPKEIDLLAKHPKGNEVYRKTPCNEYKNHLIVADKRGYFVPVKFESVEENKCKVILSEAISIEDRQEMEEHHLNDIIKNLGDKKPFIFIHGGLNGYDTSIERMYRDVDKIKNSEQNYYPIFLVWPSYIDTYTDSIFSYFQGVWDNLLDKSFGIHKPLTDLTQVPSKMLSTYLSSYRLYNHSQCYLGKYADIKARFSCKLYTLFPEVNYADVSPDSFIRNDPCENAKQDSRKGIYCEELNEINAREFTKINPLYIAGVAKLVTVPLADPTGKRAWNSMLARIRFTFRTPCPLDSYSKGDCSPGAFYQFFYRLNESALDKQQLKNITIFGHSMGAIVSGEIIREFPELPYESIVFGGAAISIREFKNTVEATLKKKHNSYKEYSKHIEHIEENKKLLIALKDPLKSDKENTALDKSIEELEEMKRKWESLKEKTKPFTFYNLSLHPYADAREENGYGSVPAGSLLELVDQIIESPSTGLDLTLGKWANIAPLLSPDMQSPYFDSELFKNDCLHFSRFGLNKNQPYMHTHFGNNDDDIYQYWEPKNWRLKLEASKQCNASN